MRALLLSLAFFTASAFSADAIPASNSITVYVYGLRNSDGHVRVALYSEKGGGFPNNAKKAVIVGVVAVKEGRAGVRFDNIPPGTYAVSCFHDENDNKELDEDQSFKPTEGIGASRDAQGTLGPPKFHDASFGYDGHNVTVKITVRYLPQ